MYINISKRLIKQRSLLPFLKEIKMDSCELTDKFCRYYYRAIQLISTILGTLLPNSII